MNSQHQMGMEIFAHHTSVMIILFVSILVNLTLIYYFFRHRKNIRCLRYCYIDLSDWVIRKIGGLTSVVELYSESANWGDEETSNGDDETSNDVSDDFDLKVSSQQEWIDRLKYHKGMFERRKMSWVDEYDLSYPLEDESRQSLGEILGGSKE